MGFRLPGKAPRYQRHTPGVMNKTEAKYAAHLDLQKSAGLVWEWWYEGFTFKLAKDCRLTPDFVCQVPPDGHLVIREVKGCRAMFKDDAKVKMRLLSSLYPFKCTVVYPQKGGGWEEQEF